MHLSVSAHAKLKGKAVFPSSEEIPPGLQPLPAFRHSLSPASGYSHWHGWCWPCTGRRHLGEPRPMGWERWPVTSLHCMTREVSADLVTGCHKVPALSLLNLYLEIFHAAIHAMWVTGRAAALWSTWLCQHLQWVVTYFIFKLDCSTPHRGSQCALKREASAQKLGSIS